MRRGKQERKLNRLKDYDYSLDGFYFVTICTKGFVRYFGSVIDDCMELSQIGKVTRDSWLAIPQHFQNACLDEFIIMPNHIHGIIKICNNSVGNADLRPLQRQSLPDWQGQTKMYLPTIIHGFKSSVTRRIRRRFNNHEFAWQRSFYDHIIRTEKSLNNIRQYIIDNPTNWNIDRNSIRQLPE